MAELNDFEGKKHLIKIREKLWAGDEFGQAAIMVGAGFSRNAEKNNPAGEPFPLWFEVANCMFRELYPDSNGPDDKNFQIQKTADTLNLAEEYVTEFGQNALNNLLYTTIQDDNYKPGWIHELLLMLPWSDIFTTNYDTLLERASRGIFSRKYNLILNKEDLSQRRRPRIVKLHGSFPSITPYILSTEDFRTYPAKFSSFVNTVQQSIMENTFVLIGFSGEDPNFLNWIGWVRDNLGAENMPMIYLCGIFDFTLTQIKLLSNRGITVINLAELFKQKPGQSRDDLHKEALSWFLINLLGGQKQDLNNWPKPRKNLPEIKVSEFGKLYPKSPALILNSSIDNDFSIINHHEYDFEESEDREKYAVSIVSRWSKLRATYPGWLVLPSKNREKVYEDLIREFDTIFLVLEQLSFPLNLNLLFECIWMSDISLFPLYCLNVGTIETILDKIKPFPENLNNDIGVEVTPANPLYANLKWSELTEKWLLNTFALLRLYREGFDSENHHEVSNNLESIVELNPEWKLEWLYEKCLYALSVFDEISVKKYLPLWPDISNNIKWLARRAQILLEIGEYSEAIARIENAYSLVKEMQQSEKIDTRIASLESWVICLYQIANNSIRERSEFNKQHLSILHDTFQARWESLSVFRTDPWYEIDKLSDKLESELPYRVDLNKKTKGFHEWQYKSSRILGGHHRIVSFRHAFQGLYLVENGLLPIRTRDGYLPLPIFANRWLFVLNPAAAILRLVRCGQDDSLDFLDKLRVAVLSQEHIGILYRLLGPKTGFPVAGAKWLSRDKLRIKVLARISFRLSRSEQAELFDFAIRIYNEKLEFSGNTGSIPELLGDLFVNVYYSARLNDWEMLTKKTIALKIPTLGKSFHNLREPAYDLERYSYNFSFKEPIVDKESLRSVDSLLGLLNHDESLVRNRALERLFFLFEKNGLTSEYIEKFKTGLWEQVDDFGLPKGIQYFSRQIVPGLGSDKFESLIKEYILQKAFPRSYSLDSKTERRSYSDTSRPFYFVFQILEISNKRNDESSSGKWNGITWAEDEAAELLLKAIAWWNDEKETLQEEDPFAFVKEQLKSGFLRLLQLLAYVIFPKLSQSTDAVKDRALNLILDMERSDLPILVTLPSLLYLDKITVSECNERLSNALYYGIGKENDFAYYDSLYGALIYWMQSIYENQIPKMPKELKQKMFQNLVKSENSGFSVLIFGIIDVLDEGNSDFDEDIISQIITIIEVHEKMTRFPNLDYIEFESPLNVRGEFSKIPEQRGLISHLAKAVYLYLEKKELEIPEALSELREVFKSDNLPDIWRPWEDNGED